MNHNSILMAVKAYREFARSRTTTPELYVVYLHTRVIDLVFRVCPVTAHAAFDKACGYFGIKIVHIPLDKDMKVDTNKLRKAINKNTIAVRNSRFDYGC